MAEVHDLPFAAVTTSALWARFPRLVQTAVEGVWQTQCPVDREHGIFEVCEADDGWRIRICADGCLPREIWAAGGRPQAVPDGPRFKLESLSALLTEDIPPTKWLLTPYVPAASFGELVGPPGKGKTTFMAWMIMQMAKAGYRCAIIEEEGSRRGLQRLLRRALEAVGGGVAESVSFMHAQHFNLLNASDVSALAVALAGHDFVLLDSFNLVTPGLDEDKAKEMGPVIRDIRWLRDELNAAVWLNHHSGKSNWKSGEVPRLGDGRGSSALPGALDAELSMKPADQPAEGFIEFDLYVTKMREGDDQVRPQRVSIARNGPAAIATLQDLEGPSPRSAAIESDTYSKIPEKPDSVSKKFLEHVVRGHRAQEVRRAVDRLVDSGRVIVTASGRYVRTDAYTASGRPRTTPDDPPSSRSSPPRRGGTTDGTRVPRLDATQRAAGEKEDP